MTWWRWLSGLTILAFTFGPVLVTSPRLRRRLAPALRSPVAWVADIVLALSAVVLLAELLGTLQVLRWWSLVVGGPVVGLVMHRVGEPPPVEAAPEPARRWLGGGVETVAAALAVAGVLAQAIASALDHVRHGITDPDSLHYHLTFAARFATSGSTTDLAIVSASDASPYHPANAELLHGLGMIAFRTELLTLVLNLGALALALLAAAAIGARAHHGGAAVTAAAAVLALPILGREQSGAGFNDVVAIALLLAAVALVLADDVDRRSLVLAGLAAGLAIGTKLTTAVPIAALVVALLVSRRSWRPVVPMVAAAVLTGGYWPVRNLLRVGSLYPALDVPVLPRPPMPGLDAIDHAVVDYLGDSEIVSDVYLPGLAYALGPGRWLLAALLAVAAALVVTRADGVLRRLLAVVAAVAAIAYLVTPTTAGGPEGVPVLFRFNVRYLGPAFALLAVASALARPLARRADAWSLAWLALIGITLASRGAWADPGDRALAAVAALAVLGCAALVAVRPRSTLVAIVAVGVLAGGFAAGRYVDRRYADPDTDRAELLALSRDLDGERVGVSGLPLQYPFFGPDLDGSVEYVAEVLASDEVRDPPSCAAWRAALREGDYDLVVVWRWGDGTIPDAAAWTASITGVEVVRANDAGTAFRLPERGAGTGC